MFDATPDRPTSRLVKVRAGAPLRAWVASAEWIGIRTHWLGRPVICPGEGCPACQRAMPRWRGYIGLDGERGSGIVEFSVNSTDSLHFILAEIGDRKLAGLPVIVDRRSPRSPVVFTLDDTRSSKDNETMSMTTVLEHLLRVYRLPVLKGGESMDMYVSRIRPSLIQRLSPKNEEDEYHE